MRSTPDPGDPPTTYFRRYDSELRPIGPTVRVSRQEAGFENVGHDIISLDGKWILSGTRTLVMGSPLGDAEGTVWTLLGETVIREESLGPARAVRLTAGRRTALVLFSGTTSTGSSTTTTGRYRRIAADGRLLGEAVTLPETQDARFGPGATYWSCGYLVLSPGWSGASDATDIFHVSEDGVRAALPLPAELAAKSETGDEYFFRLFGGLARTPGALFFAGRDFITATPPNNPRYSRVMMSCP